MENYKVENNKKSKIKQEEIYTPLGILYRPNNTDKCDNCINHKIGTYCTKQYCKPRYE